MITLKSAHETALDPRRESLLLQSATGLERGYMYFINIRAISKAFDLLAFSSLNTDAMVRAS
jgi:hypothetical protein